MKRSLLITLILTVGVMFTSMPSESISFKTMNWKRYNIRFKVPRHWKITKNDSKSFIAKGDGVVMAIYPSFNRRATARSIARKAYRNYYVIGNKKFVATNT